MNLAEVIVVLISILVLGSTVVFVIFVTYRPRSEQMARLSETIERIHLRLGMLAETEKET